MSEEFFNYNGITERNNKRVMNSVEEEVLDSKEKISVPEQKEKNKLTDLFFKEIEGQILELEKPFSKELVEKAYGILKYQLPKLDSFIGSHEEGAKNSWRLANKRRELYQKLEAIFEMEKERRVTNLEAEIEQEQKEEKGRKIEIPDGHDLAA